MSCRGVLQPFDLEARYCKPEELPGKTSPWIGRFSVKGVKATGGPDDFMICKLKARVNIHGVLNVESGYYVEDQEVEEEIKEDDKKEDGEKKSSDVSRDHSSQPPGGPPPPARVGAETPPPSDVGAILSAYRDSPMARPACPPAVTVTLTEGVYKAMDTD